MTTTTGFFKPPVPQRRLDSLAHIIQGDAICAAVVFLNGQFLVATNNEIKNSLADEVFYYLRQIAESSSKCSQNQSSQLYTKLKVQHSNLAKELMINAAKKSSLYKNNKEYQNRFEVALEKITRSIRHSYCKKNKHDILSDEFLKSILQEKSNVYHFKKANGVHAELRILDCLIKNKMLNGTTYIGISKKCCLNCQNAIQAYNDIHGNIIKEDNDEIEEEKKESKSDIIQVREEGHGYPFPATIPDFLKTDEKVQKKFITLSETNPDVDIKNYLDQIKKIFAQRPPQKVNAKVQLVTMSDSPTQTSEDHKFELDKNAHAKHS